MRITVQAVVQDDDGTTNLPSVLGVIDRDRDSDPASGLGLFLREAHALLKALQAVVLVIRSTSSRVRRAAAEAAVDNSPARTPSSSSTGPRSARPDFRVLGSIRAARTAAPWPTVPRTFSALARALPERVHPQWKWLQCRYASVMSFKLARTFLRDAFPGGATLPCSSVKATVRATGNRLEAEARQAILDTAA